MIYEHRDSKIVSSVGRRVAQTEGNVVCCVIEFMMSAQLRSLFD